MSSTIRENCVHGYGSNDGLENGGIHTKTNKDTIIVLVPTTQRNSCGCLQTGWEARSLMVFSYVKSQPHLTLIWDDFLFLGSLSLCLWLDKAFCYLAMGMGTWREASSSHHTIDRLDRSLAELHFFWFLSFYGPRILW